MEGKDAVRIIRKAIANALVFYYPVAGRLREYVDQKLVVECTGEGVVFVEADADVTLQQFGDTLYPPFPHVEELLPEIPSFGGVVNSPLLFFQVTRLKCGGFILAYRLNHVMFDGIGIRQFISAVAELARGTATPSTRPVWERHLLTARQPPQVSFTHREYDVLAEEPTIPPQKMVQRSFFFPAADISALHRSLSPPLQSCSDFDVLAACAWRCRTIALSPKPDEDVRFLCAMDIRKRMNPPLPKGYYGNAAICPAAVTTAGELSKKPLDYAVELVREAKRQGTDEYVRSGPSLGVCKWITCTGPPKGPPQSLRRPCVRSVVDLMVVGNRPNITVARTYLVSDVTRAGFEQVDFGWGTAAYGGVVKGAARIPTPLSWYSRFKNKIGEEGIVVPENLPPKAMGKFEKQLRVMMAAAGKMSKFVVR